MRSFRLIDCIVFVKYRNLRKESCSCGELAVFFVVCFPFYKCVYLEVPSDEVVLVLARMDAAVLRNFPVVGRLERVRAEILVGLDLQETALARALRRRQVLIRWKCIMRL